MTVDEAVRTRLLALSALTAIVGQRIYTLMWPQKPTLTAVRVQAIDDFEGMHLRGSDGLHKARVQVDVAAGTGSGVDAYANAAAAAAAVHGAYVAGVPTGLCGWSGTVGGVEIVSSIPDGVQKRYDADELKQVVFSQDFRVSYRAA